MDHHSISAPNTEPRPTPGVLVEMRGPVAYVRLARPPVNAFTTEMLVRLREVLGDLAAEQRPVLLAGARGIFSAGFDIKQPAAEIARADELSRDVLARLRTYPAPVVAAVEGAAVGLGLLIATSADLLVVARRAVLRMPEVTLGIDSDPLPLERFLPAAWIRRLCLTGAGYTPEDMHLAAAGASLCDEGCAVALAEAVMRQLLDLDVEFVVRAKQRLAFAGDPRPVAQA